MVEPLIPGGPAPGDDAPVARRVTIREVGARDGLQAETPLSIEDRVRFLDALSATGVAKIEAVSFVSPKAVPAMADAAAVWAGAERNPAVAYSALVPNRRGAEAAVEAGGFASLQAFLAAADGYNRKNVGKSVQESLEDVADVVAFAREAGVDAECSISAAFGDPYDGDVAFERVLEVARVLAEVGVTGVSLGDTTGMATPWRVWRMVDLFQQELPALRLNLHFHDTRGLAMANVFAAWQLGATEFDASAGGLGGSPFAPGSNGNVATEDVVHLFADMGVVTGVNLDRVVEAAKLAEELVGHPVPGQVSKAGPRWRTQPAADESEAE
ncbi:MAG TPA: hydroxymethylglutaryl-CoA lyase [Actinobacteria bacterium]|nr:hydroxymethylglutaryl-CoA lyase [Actinomycetota bacterium]HCP62110.1 hydroxymethylglutaryl-CoA lyase [Actinomycetota bacterium]